jgi:hypothetical protein
MSLEESVARREAAIINDLQSKQSGIDDKTGKGAAAESIVEGQLLKPYLLPGFGCVKGAIVDGAAPSEQSQAIDRIIYDSTVGAPIVFDEAHSIIPIELVCGLVEITMRMDSDKLKTDIERMAPIRSLRKRRYLVSVPLTRTKVAPVENEGLGARCFVIGLPADPRWHPETIARGLRRIQETLGPPALVHGLYVLGIGYFETVTTETKEDVPYQVMGWLGPDRLFRFSESLRLALSRWPRLPSGVSANLRDYLPGDPHLFAE